MKPETRKRFADLQQCRSCEFDGGRAGCRHQDQEYDAEIDDWMKRQRFRNGEPSQNADGCPGWLQHPCIANAGGEGRKP